MALITLTVRRSKHSAYNRAEHLEPLLTLAYEQLVTMSDDVLLALSYTAKVILIGYDQTLTMKRPLNRVYSRRNISQNQVLSVRRVYNKLFSRKGSSPGFHRILSIKKAKNSLYGSFFVLSVSWESVFPLLTHLQNYVETPPDNILTTNMSFGPPKIRKRFTANVRFLQGQFIIPLSQVEEFDDFYLNNVYGGSQPFLIAHPRTGTTIRVKIISIKYNQQSQGKWWTVDVILMVVP